MKERESREREREGYGQRVEGENESYDDKVRREKREKEERDLWRGGVREKEERERESEKETLDTSFDIDLFAETIRSESSYSSLMCTERIIEKMEKREREEGEGGKREGERKRNNAKEKLDENVKRDKVFRRH